MVKWRGGIHGANRLAGNALTEAVVFGMIAGCEAATINQTEKNRYILYNYNQARLMLKTAGLVTKAALMRKKV